MKFRKKPVVIEATQWFKPGDHPAVELNNPNGPWVKTLEGGHIVTPGDWIITGVKGEHYPCKPDIFAMTYEAAELAKPELRFTTIHSGWGGMTKTHICNTCKKTFRSEHAAQFHECTGRPEELAKPEQALDAITQDRDEWRDCAKALVEICNTEPAKHVRCQLCGYQHGHQIGCANNPVDIALAAQPSEPEPVSQFGSQELQDMILDRLAKPERKPMTDEEIDSLYINGVKTWLGKKQLVRAVEDFHGIGVPEP